MLTSISLWWLWAYLILWTVHKFFCWSLFFIFYELPALFLLLRRFRFDWSCPLEDLTFLIWCGADGKFVFDETISCFELSYPLICWLNFDWISIYIFYLIYSKIGFLFLLFSNLILWSMVAHSLLSNQFVDLF